jgi:hypothetical protein
MPDWSGTAPAWRRTTHPQIQLRTPACADSGFGWSPPALQRLSQACQSARHSRRINDIQGHWILREELKAAGGLPESPRMKFADDWIPSSMRTFSRASRSTSVRRTLSTRRTACAGGCSMATGRLPHVWATVTSAGRARGWCWSALNLLSPSFRRRCRDRGRPPTREESNISSQVSRGPRTIRIQTCPEVRGSADF